MHRRTPLLALFILVALATFSACSPADRETQVTTDLNEPALTTIWTAVADEADIQEETAVLESLQLSAGAAGPLERLHLVFHALNEDGSNEAIFVDVDAEGDLIWRRQQVERVDGTLHPADLMAALDDAAVAELAAEKGGITLLADTIAGDISYRQEHADVYLLENGQRHPIREIVFRSQSPWTTITVCAPTAAEDREVTEREGGVAVTQTVTAGDEDQCEIWFLEQTAAKANVLELQ